MINIIKKSVNKQILTDFGNFIWLSDRYTDNFFKQILLIQG